MHRNGPLLQVMFKSPVGVTEKWPKPDQTWHIVTATVSRRYGSSRQNKNQLQISSWLLEGSPCKYLSNASKIIENDQDLTELQKFY